MLSIKEHISHLSFFANLDAKQLDIISEISYISDYNKDYILYYEKKVDDKIFFLLDGLAKAYKIDKHNNEIFLYYIYPNSLISDISTLKDNLPPSFSNVKLMEDSKILSVNYKRLKELFLQSALLCDVFANEIMNKSSQLQSLINREFIFNSVAKVAMMLHKDLEIFNKLKRSEISLMLHIQPETLSRVLNRLKRDSIIDIDTKDVKVLDKTSLISLYEE